MTSDEPIIFDGATSLVVEVAELDTKISIVVDSALPRTPQMENRRPTHINPSSPKNKVTCPAMQKDHARYDQMNVETLRRIQELLTLENSEDDSCARSPREMEPDYIKCPSCFRLPKVDVGSLVELVAYFSCAKHD